MARAPPPARLRQKPSRSPGRATNADRTTTRAPKPTATKPAAKRRQTPAHGASRGTRPENHSAPQERKNSDQELARVQASIAGAERGNWRDLRTVFEFAGIFERNKAVPAKPAECRD